MAFGLVKNPAEMVLSALRKTVGPKGTIVMPAFNFDFCKGKPFDPVNSVSQTGILCEEFRKRPNVGRTIYTPFHSVCVEGPLKHEILELKPVSSFASNSVFQFLHDIDAKQLLIGCGYQQGVVHFHWLEEKFEVPYRYWKKFDGEVVGEGEKVFFNM